MAAEGRMVTSHGQQIEMLAEMEGQDATEMATEGRMVTSHGQQMEMTIEMAGQNVIEQRRCEINIGHEVTRSYNLSQTVKARRVINNTIIYNFDNTTRSDNPSGFDIESNQITSFQYVQTPDLEKADDTLEKQHRVVVCGPPGCGKTTMGRALLHKFRDKGYQAHTVVTVQELMTSIRDGKRNVVLMDGVLGETRADEKEYRTLRRGLDLVRDSVAAGNCLLISSMYPHVNRELMALDEELHRFLFPPTCFIQLLRQPLPRDVKEAMIKLHLDELRLDTPEQDALVMEILQKDVSGAAFPWCCRQMVDKWYSLVDHTVVFTTPAKPYVSFIQRMLHDREHGELMAALMSLTMSGCLHDPHRMKPLLEKLDLNRCSQYRLKESADNLRGSLLNTNGDGFESRAMYDAVGLALGRAARLHILLQVCDVRFLVQHVRTKETATEFSVTIGPSPDDRQLLMQTMYDRMVSGRLPELCQHPSLHCPQFLQEFEAFCRANKNYVQRLVGAVDPVHKLPLLYWSVWGPSEFLTEWCLSSLIGDSKKYLYQLLLEKTALATLLARSHKENVLPTCSIFLCAIKAKLRLKTMIERKLLARATLRYIPEQTKPNQEILKLALPSGEQCMTESFKVKLTACTSTIPFSTPSVDDPVPVSFWLTNISLQKSRDGDFAAVSFGIRKFYIAIALLEQKGVDETDEEGNTLLHVAADTGDREAVEVAVQSGASLTARNNKGQTPPQLAANRSMLQHIKEDIEDSVYCENCFFRACKDGDLESVKIFLCTDASVQDKDLRGDTALHVACEAGETDIAAFLINLGADVNASNRKGETPLNKDCWRGNVDTVLLLIRAHADVNMKDEHGDAPLHKVCWHRKTETARLLLEHHADVNQRADGGHTPLYLACVCRNTEIARLLLENHADVNAKARDGSTPLQVVCSSGEKELAELLMEYRANVNARRDNGYTPLHEACMNGSIEIARLLIENQADVNAKTESGLTPLHVACNSGKRELAHLLIQYHADVNAKDDNGYTPLYEACERGSAETAKLLLESHADVNAKSRSGSTPLHAACKSDGKELAQLLIQHHADVSVRDDNGYTLLHEACERGSAECAKILLENHADVNTRSGSGLTPLHAACRSGKRNCVQLMIQHHADVTMKDNYGRTPLDATLDEALLGAHAWRLRFQPHFAQVIRLLVQFVAKLDQRQLTKLKELKIPFSGILKRKPACD